MKKIVALFLTVCLVLSLSTMLSGCGYEYKELNLKGNYDVPHLKGTTLNFYNWGEYMSDGSEGSMNVVKEFEKLTGIKVNNSYFDSNETMYAQIKGEGVAYDLIIPSDYMIERLKNEDLLQPLDYSKITNYDLIDSKYKDLFFDPENKFSVPYNVGMVGLIYNSTMVDERPDSWNIMWDKKYEGNILTFNNPRDAFSLAQIVLGQDLNTKTKEDWDATANKLIEQKPLIQSYVMDEVFNKMEMGEAAIAPYYAGDFLTMKENNPDLEFVYPKEGVNIFVDSMCIPKNAQNVEAANLFINFLLEPDVALSNAEYICYASPNTSVINNENYSLKDEKILYPDEEDMPITQYFHDMDSQTRAYYDELWQKVKLH
ncbi:MAG: spermidine/putrescine ABC transporter substrate-binding protein [Clostridia bacterium]|nr:spermidine/putrescine ABC transporter substrate-binding protein [Clostridia bacterium]